MGKRNDAGPGRRESGQSSEFVDRQLDRAGSLEPRAEAAAFGGYVAQYSLWRRNPKKLRC